MDPLVLISASASLAGDRTDPLDLVQPIQVPQDARQEALPEPEAWALAFLHSLTSKDVKSIVELFKLRRKYASDCSGADAPYLAIKILQLALQHTHQVGNDCWQIAFQSEDPSKAGDAPRKFCDENFSNRLSFDDFIVRGATGKVHGDGQIIETPGAHLYFWGSVCRDISRANTSRKRLMGDNGGLSTQTFNAGLRFIEIRDPPYFLQENAYNKQALAFMLAACRARLPHFAVKVFVIDALAYRQKAARIRMFIVGINMRKVHLSRPFNQWLEVLHRLAHIVPATAESDVTLQDGDPLLERGLRELSERMQQDRQWETCKNTHSELRTRLNTVYKFEVDSPEFARRMMTDTERSFTTRRAGDVLALHRSVAKHVLGIDVSQHSFNWDISQNVLYTFHKDPSAANFYGTILRSHIYWNTYLNRPRVGFEHLLAQGFPRWVRVDGLHDRDMRGLAGDTINVVVIGALLTTLFTSTTLEHDAPSDFTYTDDACDAARLAESCCIQVERFAKPLFGAPYKISTVDNLGKFLEPQQSQHKKARRLVRESSIGTASSEPFVPSDVECSLSDSE